MDEKFNSLQLKINQNKKDLAKAISNGDIRQRQKIMEERELLINELKEYPNIKLWEDKEYGVIQN